MRSLIDHVFSVLLITSLFAAAVASSQTAAPYAEIDPRAVGYAGPGRDAAHDLPGTEIRIGLIVPLQGPREAEGKALRLAAQLALQDEAAVPFPDHRRLALAVRDESGPWGRASSEIVRLVFDDRAVALVTSAEGGTAHLAEQVGNKIGIPILTLSSDATTTEINLPWIFRLGPTDAAEARAFARDIYGQRKLSRVVLVTEENHDGRLGGEEFEKAAQQFRAASPPLRITLSTSLSSFQTLAAQISASHPEALVLWTGPESAAALIPFLRETMPAIPIYLCSKAGQSFGEAGTRERCRTCPASAAAGDLWTASSARTASAEREAFERRYRERAGIAPSATAAEAYDAVRLLATALRESGPNRARLRDALVKQPRLSGVSGPIAFDGAGNNQVEVKLVPLP